EKFIALLMNNDRIHIPKQFRNVPFLRFPVICKDFYKTNLLVNLLKKQGYEVGNFNWSPTLNKVINWNEKCPNAEKISSNIINVPCHADVIDNDIEKICQTINKNV
ncbi:MAG: DegT/DnrJ/EryC1/StrS family aminotransferase, partial [Promethearchaeota archaeon]